ncbi:MAG: hypothetical protein ACFFCS_14870 [Candidatus Hodarchaeota archaeon]
MENEQNRSLLNGELANTTEIGTTMPVAASTFESGEHFMERIMQALDLIYRGLVPKVKKWWSERKAKKHEQEGDKKMESAPVVVENPAFIPVESSVF